MTTSLDDLKKQFGDRGDLTGIEAPANSVYLRAEDMTEDEIAIQRQLDFHRVRAEVLKGTISDEQVATAGERIEAGQMIRFHPVTGLAYVCNPTPPRLTIRGTANAPKLDDGNDPQ
jgi:hypothetical protein